MKKLLFGLLLAATTLFSLANPVHGFDERTLKMKLVLEDYNSPMLGAEEDLIRVAQKYELDWTLLAAIAGTESAFGRRMPENCINPYGWGIYPGSRLCFNSFQDAASAVGEGLSTRYNTTSLETIAATYNKVSTDSWVRHTRYFMNKIKNYEIPVEHLPITL